MSDKNPDEELAKESWLQFKNAFRVLIASAGVGVIFSARACIGCDSSPPTGIDFEWYGNHCGPGHGNPDDPAIDELDEACKRHDAALEKMDTDEDPKKAGNDAR